MKRLVLAGGGHAHVEVLRDFAASPPPDVSVTLLTPQPRLTYTGMLPGHIAGHYSLEDISLDLRPLAARAGIAVVQGEVSLVDPSRREVVCADGSSLAYDALSLNVGSRPLTSGVDGVERHAVTVRPLERLVEGWEDVLRRAREGGVGAITLVGGGAAGVELALAMAWRLLGPDIPVRPHIRILEHGREIVPELPFGARARLEAALGRLGVAVHRECTVGGVERDVVRLTSGLRFATDATFWAAGAAGPPWIGDSGLAIDLRGFARINEHLQSLSHPEVFAAGDCAIDEGRPTARAGVFAVRAGPILAANLRAFLGDGPLRPFVPPRRYLALVSTGRKHAVGVWGPLAWQGGWAWRWKDRIDREWMAKYQG